MAPASRVHLVGDCSFSLRNSCFAWLWYCCRSRPDCGERTGRWQLPLPGKHPPPASQRLDEVLVVGVGGARPEPKKTEIDWTGPGLVGPGRAWLG